ncbi:DNA replication complex GINS protein PSF1-like [Bombyx mandarina]|uniref:DNA replication complex GINS protein PSF1 n=3 Tax=Bombyx TaxID=7090 RepID=A0A8R2AMI7_BOMMO|nr:DNA replication complex GINS protein PSF1 isoform X1 [Bombyx mori]XP_028036032.1 DNA replication complex GINS protein PSF1-like [Bombyx mandarina]
MFAEKVIELIKEVDRNPDTIDQYNDEKIRQIIEEMHLLFKLNMNDANATTENRSLWTTVQVRHSALERNKRCILAYLYNRMKKIKTLRWEFGAVLPPDIRELLSDDEYQWFSKYSGNLALYMRSLGQDIGYSGIDLTENLKPPKSLFIEVLCVVDYGKLELEDGDVVMLKKNSRHYLPTSECQTLIRQGILKQIM